MVSVTNLGKEGRGEIWWGNGNERQKVNRTKAVWFSFKNSRGNCLLKLKVKIF